MRTAKKITLCCLLVLCVFALYGCAKKADENKPIEQVKAEADQMSVDKLKAMAMTYKDAIVAKKGEAEKLLVKIKAIPVTELLGEEAKGLKADLKQLGQTTSSLKARFNVYYTKLKEKNGDMSGLEI